MKRGTCPGEAFAKTEANNIVWLWFRNWLDFMAG